MVLTRRSQERPDEEVDTTQQVPSSSYLAGNNGKMTPRPSNSGATTTQATTQTVMVTGQPAKLPLLGRQRLGIPLTPPPLEEALLTASLKGEIPKILSQLMKARAKPKPLGVLASLGLGGNPI
uniref:Uncharacterized protein n=1 Tax=Cannabis sativa TaxID=3483 RepID=A0A803QGV7_CANSA